MKYKLAIVTVTYNPDKDMLAQCLDSIYRYNDIGDTLKIVVVDNSPTETSIISIFSQKYKDVLFIPAPENKGFGYSNNKGFDAIDSEYVLFFNNDTELIEPIFQKIIQKFEKDEKLGCLGIKQMNNSTSFFKKTEVKMNYFKMKRLIYKNEFDSKNFYLAGSFLFMRSTVFIASGKFDENIFLYYEEPDICNRIDALGFSVIYDYNLSYVHKIGNRRVFSEKTYQESLKSFVYYMVKYNRQKEIHRVLKSKINFLRCKCIWNLIICRFNVLKELRKAICVHKRELRLVKSPCFFIKILTFISPWRLKRFLFRNIFLYDVDDDSYVGFSWIFPKYLQLQKGAVIDHLTVAIHLDAMYLGEKSFIGRNNWITGFPTKTQTRFFKKDLTRKSELKIGAESAITKNHHIDCTNQIEIGDFVTIAGYGSQLLTHSIDVYENIQKSYPIKIGSYSFVGTKVIILGGATLPDYSILAAGSVLKGAFEDPLGLYAGVPAVLKKRLNKEDVKYFCRTEGVVY